MRVLLLLAMVVTVGSCATSPPQVETPAPNPNGCFLFLYDRAGFNGSRYLVNGPVRLASLDRMASDSDWNRRIQSLEVGSATSVALFTGENFSGRTTTVPPATRAPSLTTEFAGQVRSLTLSCDGVAR